MAKKVKALIVVNKKNHQINLTLPKRKISKKTLVDLKNSKRIEIELGKSFLK